MASKDIPTANQGAQAEGWMGHEGVKPDVLGMFDMAGKVAY